MIAMCAHGEFTLMDYLIWNAHRKAKGQNNSTTSGVSVTLRVSI